MPVTLTEWLQYQDRIHPTAIDLGLERCHNVARQMGLLPPPFPCVSIAGTNGKGSSAAMLDAILRAAGCRTGLFTSPHLLVYNERICVDGTPVTDAVLCETFARIEQARGTISLTAFEFSTLAALAIFQAEQVEFAVLEVGLGGRLDAVNIVDAQVALLTALDIDHSEWLGKERDTVALEKAGILRAGHPAVCADPAPPTALLDYARELEVTLSLAGRNFESHSETDHWTWESKDAYYTCLPLPALPGEWQVRNAAGVLQTVQRLVADGLLPGAGIENAIHEGLRQVRLPGRWQHLPGRIETIVDVGHNPLGGRALARQLALEPAAETHALVAMLTDKDIAGTLAPLLPHIHTWHVSTPDTPRGAAAASLEALLQQAGATQIITYPSVAEAYRYLRETLPDHVRLLVFGSFYTVREVLDR